MKKIFCAVVITAIAFINSNAQSFINKVPTNSSVIIKYSADNFSKTLPLNKVDSYGFIQNVFFKKLHLETPNSLKNVGVDFEKEVCQYVLFNDSCTNFVSLMHLNNTTNFENTLKAYYGEQIKKENKNGFTFISAADDMYIGWNESIAILVSSTYQHRKDYYYNYYNTDSTTSVVPVDAAMDTIVTFSPPTIVKEKPAVKSKSPVKKAAPNAKPGQKKSAPVKKAPAPKKKVIKELTEEERYAIQDSIENMKRELWNQQQDMIARKKQLAAAENIIIKTLTNNISNVVNKVEYNTIIAADAPISIYLNYEDISRQYMGNMYKFGALYGAGSGLKNNMLYAADTSDGFKTGINIYFDKDKMRMEQKTFTTDEKLKNMGKAMMNSKQNSSLINYINKDNIGYASISVNNEALMNYYYTVLKKSLSNTPYLNEYSDLINMYIDLMEIIIDEKGIAELMPGNYLFVLHDMKTKWVTYTDYEYDSEYNAKEIKKQKKELSPNFSFIMETQKESFMEKLVKLPLKYAQKEGFDYKDKGEYFQLAFDTSKYPISNLYFIVKDNKAIITTSLDVINIATNKGSFEIDTETRNSILNNNYSLKINTEKLLDELANQLSTPTTKKINEYFIANMGNMQMESNYKDGIIQGNATIKIKGNHNNSLEFIFNMIDAVNNILEKEKADNEEKLN